MTDDVTKYRSILVSRYFLRWYIIVGHFLIPCTPSFKWTTTYKSDTKSGSQSNQSLPVSKLSHLAVCRGNHIPVQRSESDMAITYLSSTQSLTWQSHTCPALRVWHGNHIPVQRSECSSQTPARHCQCSCHQSSVWSCSRKSTPPANAVMAKCTRRLNLATAS